MISRPLWATRLTGSLTKPACCRVAHERGSTDTIPHHESSQGTLGNIAANQRPRIDTTDAIWQTRGRVDVDECLQTLHASAACLLGCLSGLSGISPVGGIISRTGSLRRNSRPVAWP